MAGVLSHWEKVWVRPINYPVKALRVAEKEILLQQADVLKGQVQARCVRKMKLIWKEISS